MSLDETIEQVRAEAGWEAVLLTDLKGKITGSARADDTAPEMLDALLHMALRVAARPEDRAALAKTGQSTFFDWEGRQVICRYIDPQAPTPYLLILLVPHSKAYVRAAARLVRRLILAMPG